MVTFPNSGHPVSAALAFLSHPAGRGLLFIRREREPFRGLWGLPGGKIRLGEHPLDAAAREIFEETGARPGILALRAVVSEIFFKNKSPVFHAMLFLAAGRAGGAGFKSSSEGALKYFSPGEIAKRKKDIIPSDYMFINNIFIPKKSGLFRAEIAVDGGYRLLKFAREK